MIDEGKEKIKVRVPVQYRPYIKGLHSSRFSKAYVEFNEEGKLREYPVLVRLTEERKPFRFVKIGEREYPVEMEDGFEFIELEEEVC